MHRRRPKKLRDTLRGLRHCTDIRDDDTPSGYTGTLSPSADDTVLHNPADLPQIDTLDMRVDRAVHDDGRNDRRTLGCIADVAITLFPKDAAEAAGKLAVPGAPQVCDPGNVTQEVLGFDDEQAGFLYEQRPDEPGTPPHPVTPH